MELDIPSCRLKDESYPGSNQSTSRNMQTFPVLCAKSQSHSVVQTPAKKHSFMFGLDHAISHDLIQNLDIIGILHCFGFVQCEIFAIAGSKKSVYIPVMFFLILS